jgi:hypothetical protein
MLYTLLVLVLVFMLAGGLLKSVALGGVGGLILLVLLFMVLFGDG